MKKLNNMDKTYSQHAAILKKWGEFGQRYIHKVPITSDWGSIESFIKASNNLLSQLKEDTKDLLKESSKLLSPLQDPFEIDLSSNRWFAGRREEGYSDWFAWILEQLDTSDLFDLLKISNENLKEECKGIKPEIEREDPVEEGHEGQEGRLDITIRYPQKLLIVIEVKVGSAEVADLEKNKGYKKAAEKKYPDENEKIYRLLVTEAQKDPYDDGFKVLRWDDLCIKFRKMIADKKIKNKNPLVASLILAFAGAVEQNLYKLPYISDSQFNIRKTYDYLKKN